MKTKKSKASGKKTSAQIYPGIPEPGTKHLIHPQLRNNTCYCFFKVAMRMRAKLDYGLTDYQLVVPQFAILRLLGVEGRATQAEIAQYMAMDKATMVRMVDGLEKKRYLKRVQSAEDRRANFLELTSGGEKLVKKLNKLREQHEAEFLAPLSKVERESLHTIVTKLLF